MASIEQQLFPQNVARSIPTSDYRQRSQGPITTSTSLVAMVYDKGVLIAGDLLVSYGSLARYTNCPRVIKVNDNIILGASGDYADFQYIKSLIEEKVINEECLNDGLKMKPKSLFCWLTRILYNRRSKMDPLWNELIVAGIEEDGTPFLGVVDKLGTAYKDNIICTGFGSYLATPLIRQTTEKKEKLTLAEAKDLVEKSMEILYYRDARSFPKFQLGIIDAEQGVKIEGPLKVNENWNIAHYVKGY